LLYSHVPVNRSRQILFDNENHGIKRIAFERVQLIRLVSGNDTNYKCR